MARTRLGRPAQFRNRKNLVVLLEAGELAALRSRATADGLSASAFVRVLIQKALAGSARRKE